MTHRSSQLAVLFLFLLAACAPVAGQGAAAPTTPVPLASGAVITAVSPSLPTPTLIPRLWVDSALPVALRAQVILPQGWEWAQRADEALARLQVGMGSPQGYWVYALVGRFATLQDEVSAATLRSAWRGEEEVFSPLYLEPETLEALNAWWGQPAEGVVRIVLQGDLVDALWEHPEALGILPFDRLEPRLKVLAVDGESPIRKNFDPAVYPLALPYTLQTDEGVTAAVSLPSGNRDPQKLTVVAVTGVTALVRATAWMLDQRGVDYAIEAIAPWLTEADITHINNEVAFRENCPRSADGLNDQGLVVFPCSDSRYLALLEAIGTDVVEMTGDHFIDARPEDVLYTLDLYHQRGWQTYGGGGTLAEGYQPALFEHNGNRIAFIGCNAKGPGYARASVTTPGAALCDFDRLTAEIARLRAQGYLPIVTFSHIEYETFAANPLAVRDFRRVAEAGAVIVSGSQGHLPQAMEFYHGAFLHYGLGNLFFDQWSRGEPFDEAFIDHHVFYEGRHLSTELLTLRFVDFARSRPMTIDERRALLQTIFAASGW